MDLWQAVVLGALQGIFEWLPVSSQGQVMALAVAFFKLSAEHALRYAVMLHAGTLLAATIYFRKELTELLQLKNRQLLKFLLVALAATVITAIPCYLLLKMILSYNSFFLLLFIGLFLILTGVSQKSKGIGKEAKLSKINAFFLGLAQGLSVLPGISRSGITTSTLLFEGFKPEQAFRISFILSIPSVFIAEIAFGTLKGFVLDFNALIAMLVAFILGLLLIDVLLKMAKHASFSKFCIAFGILYILIAIAEAQSIF